MCGIVGYIGEQQVAPLLIQGLKRLEYRGYDSAGVAVVRDGTIQVRKEAGKIVELEKAIEADPVEGVYGIGHTRWATHGPPTTRNAHPHMSEKGDFAVVHNGIIENAGTLRKLLQGRGHVFSSETDTEVLVHLIEEMFEKGEGRAQGSLERAVEAALGRSRGRTGSPWSPRATPTRSSPRAWEPAPDRRGRERRDVRGVRRGGRHRAHPRGGVPGRRRHGTITPGGYTVHRPAQGPVSRPVSHVDWDLSEVERGGYPHFMLKEIMEQPNTLRETMRGRLLPEEGGVKLGGLTGMDEELRRCSASSSWGAAPRGTAG
jgi:glucosamine--fructose-6-phosphate aminotransferase (isomerizing)